MRKRNPTKAARDTQSIMTIESEKKEGHCYCKHFFTTIRGKNQELIKTYIYGISAGSHPQKQDQDNPSSTPIHTEEHWWSSPEQ